MAKLRGPSAAVLRARERRAAAAGKKQADIQWFIKEVSDRIEMTMRQRVRISTELLKTSVIRNISRPVKRSRGPRGGLVVERSKPGEYPRADTTMLLKTIITSVRKVRGAWEGYIGTPLDYGLILEVSKRLNRTYLRRTFSERQQDIKRILSGPIKGGKQGTANLSPGRLTIADDPFLQRNQ